MINQELWNACCNYHGHSCGGIAIGFRAANYGLELMADEIDEDDMNKIHCIITTDKCPADGIRFLVGATEENGRLKIELPEDGSRKMYFKFYLPDDNGNEIASVEFEVKPKPQNIKPEESVVYYLMSPEHTIFELL